MWVGPMCNCELQVPGCDVCFKLREASSASVRNLVSSGGHCSLEVTTSHRHVTLGHYTPLHPTVTVTPATDTEGRAVLEATVPVYGRWGWGQQGKGQGGPAAAGVGGHTRPPLQEEPPVPCPRLCPPLLTLHRAEGDSHVPSSQAHGETWVS